ncbi:MAG: phospholipid carrier-dependent glycosyltransferase, partial [Actinobacteria bacterium]|nr:phospholipid carrier-dependent glycosyltransferase [Actinomycetota bacterium]
MTATLEARAESAPDPADVAEPTRTVPASLQAWADPNPRAGLLLLLLVTAVAALTRLWALGFPQGKSFDEVYYATEASEILRFGYEDNPGYTFIVHPPLGKLLIALGEWLWDSDHAGYNTIGYRIVPAVAGIVSVVLLTRIARRMFHSNVLGAVAGLLLALDGVSVVQSRVALLDIFLQLFIVAGFGALVIDRDQMRARLAGLLAEGADLSTGVPTLGPRPWRLIGGVLFGCACGVKWTALSFYVLFCIMSVVWDRGALKAAGARRPWRSTFRRSFLPSLGPYGVAPFLTYLLVNLGWFAGEDSWNRHWADTHGSHARIDLKIAHIPFNWGWLPGPLRSLGDYVYNAYEFHEGLDSFHPYKSNPWSWLVLGRPVTYYYPSNPQGCGATSCSREILLIGTPLMWWAFVPALLWLAW